MSARVLVVDDIPVNVKLLEAKLLVEYYEVVTAKDGPTALDVVKRESPDIVLLDVMMPGMDGYEVCGRIKSDPETAHIPVVMVTALNEVSDRVCGLEAGADDFLTKPVNDIALFARIRSLVRLKRASDEWRARAATAEALGISPSAEDAVDENAPGTVLLIGDGLFDSESVHQMLASQGHDVTVADTDAEALDLVAARDFDLVLLADGERQSDALRFCSQLRSQPEHRHQPILLAVPDSANERLAKALELGVNDYLVRPIERDELIARSRTQIRRKRYEERLRDNYTYSVNAAVTDSLTGMYNRRYLESHFQRVCERLGDAHKPISALMIDIDHFKLINDTHGHDIGDEVLQGMAKRIQGDLRGFDTAVRYGGEEFVILLPDSSLSAAAATAERLCRAISATPLPTSSHVDGIGITVSIGVATAIAGQEGLDDLIRRSDQALYEAKNAGRDQVMMATAELIPSQPVSDLDIEIVTQTAVG
jgi:two-component system cell cycle response regulator